MTAIAPHGGTLINLVASNGTAAAELDQLAGLPVLDIDARAAADIELLATGAYSPLAGFMGLADYRRVIGDMRLASGVPWPLPITLRVGDVHGFPDKLVLRGAGVVAVLEVQEVFTAPREKEAELVFGTTDAAHPGVAQLLSQGEYAVSGSVRLLRRSSPPFPDLALDPADTRRIFAERGWRRVVGFQTRNPVHRAHEYIQKAALETVDGLLLHPLIGPTKDDDIPAPVRVRSYRVLLDGYYPKDRVLLSAFPAAMRYAGPREAIFHALVRKNYGCTHFIVGRDHAGVGSYYGSYDAQKIFERFEPGEIGIQTLNFENTFYCRSCGATASSKTCPHEGDARLTLSGTKVRDLLRSGQPLPAEFSRPEVAAILAQAYKEAGA